MISKFSAIFWLLHTHIILEQVENKMAPPYYSHMVDKTAKSLANAKAKREALLEEAQCALEQEEALKLALAAESAACEKHATDDDLRVFMTIFDNSKIGGGGNDDDHGGNKKNNRKNTSNGNHKGRQ